MPLEKRKQMLVGAGLIGLGVALEAVDLMPSHWPAWLGWTQFALGVLISGLGVALYFRSKGHSVWFAIPVAVIPLYGPALSLLVRSAEERERTEALEAAMPALEPHADPRVRSWTGGALGVSWLLEAFAMFGLSRPGTALLGESLSQGLCLPLMLASMCACGIFLGMYASARGQNPASGLLAIVPLFGPLVGLLDLAIGMRLSVRGEPDRMREKAREWGFVLFFFGVFILTSPAAGGIGAGMIICGLFLYLGYVGAAFVGRRALVLSALAGLIGGCSIAGTTMMTAPHYGGLIRKSSEGATKGNLGNIRAALSRYYGDTQGKYPPGLDALSGKYLDSLPFAKTPNFHPDSSAVLSGKKANDAGGWLYDGENVFVNCTHTDTKGNVWSSY